MTESDPTQTPPPYAALPGEVEAALMDSFLCMVHAFSDEGRKQEVRELHAAIYAHIAALTAQNAALVAERDALRVAQAAYESWRDEWIAKLASQREEIEALRSTLQRVAEHFRATSPKEYEAAFASLKAQGEASGGV